MRFLPRTPFGAVCRTEMLLNSKRVVPYAMAVLFGANALLWWGWGAAAYYGVATNSEFYIVRNFTGFSFLTLPLFTAVIMGDPVIRDFRLDVAPLIFSKPVGRAQYLLGKFCGNFFVLVACQAAFALMLLALQAVNKAGMLVQPVRVWPYFKHFFVFVVISHLALAAFYFTVGTLTRNAKLVYALAVSFYPLDAAYQVFILKSLPARWRAALDPLLLNWMDGFARGRSADWLNQLTISYDAGLFLNRAFMLLSAAACLTILYRRFVLAERRTQEAVAHGIATLNLAPPVERLDTTESFTPLRAEQAATSARGKVALPVVKPADAGVSSNLKKLCAALRLEFRLLRAERSLVLIIPLAVFLSTLELAFYRTTPAPSYTAAYASSTAQALLLFLFGLTVFYTGEAMHRDRELRVEPLLWSAPAPNYALLLSKFLATVLLNLALIASVAFVAVGLQFYKGDTPVAPSGYLLVYALVLLPSVVVIAAFAVLLNVLLRDKYLTYAVSIAAGIGLFYLYSQGYRHWLYNPVLYQLWTYVDLTNAGSNQTRILTHRVYWLAIACACLTLAHVLFERQTTKSLPVAGRLNGSARSLLLLILSIAVALSAGSLLVSAAH